MKTKKYRLLVCSREPESDVVFSEYSKNLKIDLDTAKELVKNRFDFTEGKPHYFIIDLSNVKHISREANEYMKDPEGGAKNILGGAFIAANPVSALLANVFIKKVTSVPVKFFFNKTDALSWIKQLKKEQKGNDECQ